MPTLHRLPHSKATIKMYADDHAPPHVHVEGPGWDGLVSLKTLEVFRGLVPPAVLTDARAWLVANAKTTSKKWSELNERDN